ncbi:MAG: cysteine desulfurase family protein [Kiloniellales bacterium]
MARAEQGPIYLDYNASAPLRPEAAAAIAETLTLPGNPSSVHAFGRAARAKMEAARAEVAALVAAKPANVVFTGSGTEANNLALAQAAGQPILVSAGEHASILEAAPNARRAPLLPSGLVDLEALKVLLAGKPALVSLQLANNETGAVQPVADAAALAREAGALFHCDAVQAAGRMAIDMVALGADLLSLSAHKLGGPKGVGALVISERVAVRPLIKGGGQERRYRAGTENLSGIAGFGAAARIARDFESEARRVGRLRDALETGVRNLAPEATIHGQRALRLPNTSCFSFPELRAETQVMALDLAGVAVGAGAACSSGKVTPSEVLTAMGVPPAAAATAIRVSFGWASEERDVEVFLDAWGETIRRSLRSAQPAA